MQHKHISSKKVMVFQQEAYLIHYILTDGKLNCDNIMIPIEHILLQNYDHKENILKYITSDYRKVHFNCPLYF